MAIVLSVGRKALTYQSGTTIVLSTGRMALTYESRAAIAHRALVDMIRSNQQSIIRSSDPMVEEN